MKKRIFTAIVCLFIFVATFPICTHAATAYTVTFDLENVQVDFDDSEDIMAAGVFAYFSADEGYMMPEKIVVTVGGQEISEYRYGQGVTLLTGDLLIKPEQITGDIVVTVSGVAKYDVTFKGEMFSVKMPVPDGKSFKEAFPDYNYPMEKEGYDFAGWFESNDGGVTFAEKPFDFNAARTESATLYPKWIEKTDNIPTPTPTPSTMQGVQNPGTGDSGNDVALIGLMASFIIASVCLMLVIIRKRVR